MLSFETFCEKVAELQASFQTTRHPENQSSHKHVCVASEWFELQMNDNGKGVTHKHDGVLRFVLRPPQVSEASSEGNPYKRMKVWR